MITSRTPYRVSFFGGGTDYKKWFAENGGAFISMGINKYCYIQCRHLPPFFDYNSRIVWSKIEQVNDVKEITHPAIRTALIEEQLDNIEIHHIGDLPARSGLGSSSSFSVGLLNVLRGLKNIDSNQYDLSRDAIHLERNILKEVGGIQDQIAASFGGFNYVKIHKNGQFDIQKIEISNEKKVEFENALLLVFTGIFRNSFEIAKEKVKGFSDHSKQLNNIATITETAHTILQSNDFISDFGKLLDETWQNKKALNRKISNPVIDDIYENALSAGALGGKLLGAGAGGFMIFITPSNKIDRVKKRLHKLIQVPIKIDQFGTTLHHGEFELTENNI